MSEVKGILEKFVIWLLGTSWKTTIYGIVLAATVLVPIYFPQLIGEGHIDKIIQAVTLILFGKETRSNNVNDEKAGVPHR